MNLPPVPGGSADPAPPPSPPPPPPLPSATAPATSADPYQGDISHWDEATRLPFKQHRLVPFDTTGVVVLGIVTLNIFAVIYHGLKYSRLPKVRPDDFSAGKAIGFLFIPFFNFYWVFVFWTRLAQRINFQFKLRHQPPPVAEGLGVAIAVLTMCSFIPGVGIVTAVVNWLILVPIFSAQIQSAANQLAAGAVLPGATPATALPPTDGPAAPPPPPGLPPPPPPPSASIAPRRNRRVIWITAGVVVLALIVLATKLEPPNDTTVRAFVEKEMSARGEKTEQVWVEGRQQQGRAVIFNVNLQGRRPRSTYYQPVAQFELTGPQRDLLALRTQLHQLVHGKDGPQLRTLAGLTTEDDSDLTAHLLREQAQTQDIVWSARGQVIAARRGFLWQMKYEPTTGFSPGGNQAQPLDNFPGRRFIVNRPDGADALAEYGRRLETLRGRLQDAVSRLVADRRAGVLKSFQAGGFFAGKVTRRVDHAGATKAEIYLEITESRLQEEPPRFSALIRNDGGWEDARLFSGELDYDQQLGRLLLRLSSPYHEQKAGAGPLLSNESQDHYFWNKGDGTALELAVVNGGLTWSEHDAELRLEPGTGANSREAVQARLAGRRQALIEATRLGQIYSGTITNRRSGTHQAWLLQFDSQEPGDDTSHDLRATLESREGAESVHALSGNLETNRYRAPDAPIRLDFTGGVQEVPKDFERDEDAGGEQLADLRLRLDGLRLVGETPRLLFRFEPAPPALADERRRAAEARQRAAEDAVLEHVRTGITYEGRMISFASSTEPVLLQFTRVEDRGAVVELQLRRKDQPEPFDTLIGRIQVTERAVSFTRPTQAERRRISPQRRTRADTMLDTWLSQPYRELQLLIEPNRLILRPDNPHSDEPRLEFPLKP